MSVYKCPKCRKHYRRFVVNVSCCVDHQGGCCHAFEQRVSKKGYPK